MASEAEIGLKSIFGNLVVVVPDVNQENSNSIMSDRSNLYNEYFCSVGSKPKSILDGKYIINYN